MRVVKPSPQSQTSDEDESPLQEQEKVQIDDGLTEQLSAHSSEESTQELVGIISSSDYDGSEEDSEELSSHSGEVPTQERVEIISSTDDDELEDGEIVGGVEEQLSARSGLGRKRKRVEIFSSTDDDESEEDEIVGGVEEQLSARSGLGRKRKRAESISSTDKDEEPPSRKLLGSIFLTETGSVPYKTDGSKGEAFGSPSQRTLIARANLLQHDERIGRHELSTYGGDIEKYYRTRESWQLMSIKAVKISRQLLPSSRKTFVQRIMAMYNECNFGLRSLFLAVRIVDFYLSRESEIDNGDWLIPTASLYIAAKYTESVVPPITAYLGLCDIRTEAEKFKQIELFLFQVLNYDLNLPHSYSYMAYYANRVQLEYRTYRLATFILHKFLFNIASININQSELGCCAILTAARIHSYFKPFEEVLSFTGYTSGDLCPVMELVKKDLMTIPDEETGNFMYQYDDVLQDLRSFDELYSGQATENIERRGVITAMTKRMV